MQCGCELSLSSDRVTKYYMCHFVVVKTDTITNIRIQILIVRLRVLYLNALLLLMYANIFPVNRIKTIVVDIQVVVVVLVVLTLVAAY